jgi:hypothetical protein
MVALVVAGAACDDLPTMPADATGGLAAEMALVANATVGAAVEDALTRLIPSLTDATAVDPLRQSLSALLKHLEDRNGDGVAEASKAALGLIASYRQRNGAGSPDAADLDAIRLALP